MATSTSGFTTVYNTYWDIVYDWGLLTRKSRNPWLRDKLLIQNKAVYFVAIVSTRIFDINHVDSYVYVTSMMKLFVA